MNELALRAEANSLALPDAEDLVAAFLCGRAATTLRAYKADLGDFARFLGAAGPGPAVEQLLAGTHGTANRIALAYRADLLARGLAPATIARRLAALRSMVKLARTLGKVAWSLEVESPRAEAYRDTRGPGPEGWRAMLAMARAEAANPKGKRDLALVRLLHDLALRRGEAVALDLADVELEAAAVMVVGKGKAQAARLTLPKPTARALAAWLDVHPDPKPEAPLFVRLDPGGGRGGRLTGESVRRVVAELGRRAGLARVPRPHGLRHQAITAALDSGRDVRDVRKFSRHAKLDTVLIYDDRRADVAGAIARAVAGDDDPDG